MGDIADDLAWQAMPTPSVEASASLDVLVDVLLERAVIRTPWLPSDHQRSERQRARDARRAHGSLREQAWEWARRVTRRPMTMMEEVVRLKDLMDAGVITEADFRHALGVTDT